MTAFFKAHIPDDFSAGKAVDPHIDHHGTLFYPAAFDKFRPTQSGHQNIRHSLELALEAEWIVPRQLVIVKPGIRQQLRGQSLQLALQQREWSGEAELTRIETFQLLQQLALARILTQRRSHGQH